MNHQRRLGFVVLLLMLAAALPGATQEAGVRAWQQRLEITIPLPVPVVALEPVNPFSSSIDVLPTLVSSSPPRKLDVSGNAEVAAYIDPKGDCLGAVPLHSPFPGLTSTLVDECSGGRFEPAKIGSTPVPAWGVIELTLLGTVKESEVVDQQLTQPEPTRPPEPAAPNRTYPSGRLLSLQASNPASLSSPIGIKNLRVRTPAREYDVPIRALVHITADGRCDRYVPLEVDSGFNPWLSAFLATWKLEPARSQGEAVDCWLIYTARIHLKINRLSSERWRVLGNRAYNPAMDTAP